MAKFVCKNCGFKTERENLKNCPYCEKKGMEKEKSAEELLEEAD